MKVIPYINGQLYDTLLPSWKEDGVVKFTQKYAEHTMRAIDKQPRLTPHFERFNGVPSAVMCPSTTFWKERMQDIMVAIVNDLGFDGVYVDQVGNGEQRSCGDPTHNHTLVGGSFWAEAFYDIMKRVRSRVGRAAVFMTEGIVEEVSGTGFDVLLGLRWEEPPIW
jgi:hypothetical protein